jgi:hypothetical protein
MSTPAADFTPLIRALEAANSSETLEGQLAIIELALVEAELNPNPIPSIELEFSLSALATIDTSERIASRGTAELAQFFEK